MSTWIRTLLACLTVTILSCCAAAQTEISLENGIDPYGSYQHGNVDSVNMVNGNVTLHIPLLSYPQRGQLRMDFDIVWNAKLWSMNVTSSNGGINLGSWAYGYGERSNAAGVQVVKMQSLYFNPLVVTTVSTSVGGTTYHQTVDLFSAATPDGGVHQYGQQSSIYSNYVPAVDGSGITPIPTGQSNITAAYDRSGVKYTWPSYNNQLNAGVNTEDSNGNEITTSSSGWTDTVGRLIPGTNSGPGAEFNGSNTTASTVDLIPGVPTTDLSGCASGASAARVWNVPGPQSTTVKYVLCYSDISYQTAFNAGSINIGWSEIGEASGTARVLTQIAQPDGNSWFFSYDSYLDLTTIQFPTGGTLQYTWENISMDPNSQAAPVTRALQQRTLNANDGSPLQTRTFSYNSNGSNWTNIVTDASGNDEVHYLYGNSQDYRTQYFQGGCGCFNHTQGVLLKTVDTDWEFIGATPFSKYPGQQYDQAEQAPSAVTTIWPNGEASRTTYTYDSPTTIPLYDFTDQNFIWQGTQPPATLNSTWVLFGNRTAVTEYDYGSNAPGVVDSGSITPGAFISTTTTALKWRDPNDSSHNYQSSNLVDLPLSITVADSAGNRCSETDYIYDEATVNSIANPQPSGFGSGNQHTSPPGSARGNLTSATHWLGALNPSATSCPVQGSWSNFQSHTIFYDTGMPYQSIDPMSHTTTYSYSGTFSGAYVTQTALPTTNSPNAAQHVVYGNYDLNTGLLSSFTDQNGSASGDAAHTTNYQYDPMFRISQALMPPDPNNGNLRPEVDYFYPDANDVEEKRKIDSNRWTDMYVKYDGLGRESRRATFNDQSGNDWDQVDTCYDNVGHVAYVSYPYQNTGFNFSNACSSPSEPGDKTTYDAIGRLKSVTHSDNSAATINYSGPSTEWIDEGNNSYSVSRVSRLDANGRLVSVCEESSAALSGPGGSPTTCSDDFGRTGFYTGYTYDPLGNLITAQQNGLASRSFSYDSLSRLGSATNPESGTTGYIYNNDGEVTTRTRPQPNQTNASVLLTTTYGYDELHRRRSISYANDLTATPASTFNYDETTGWGGVTLSNPTGRLTSEYAGPGAGVAASLFSYDSSGHTVNDWQCTPRTCGTSSNGLSYSYDLLGDVTSQTNGVGVTFGSNYNAEGKLTSMSSNYSNGPATLISNIAYGPFGMTSASFGNGWNENRQYHQRGWLQAQQDGPLNITAATPGASWASTGGSLQHTVVGSAPAVAAGGSVSIAGGQGFIYTTPCTNPREKSTCTKFYPSTQITVTVNGVATTTYVGSDSATAASEVASAINNNGSAPVTASWTSGSSVVYLTAKTAGAVGNGYSLSTSVYYVPNSHNFNSTFTSSASGPYLTNGADANPGTWNYDSGTTSVTTNPNTGSTHTTNYSWSGSGTTPVTIAAGLCSAINSDAGAVVFASTLSTTDDQHQCPANTATTYLISRNPGTAGNYPFSAGSSSSLSSFSTQFSSPLIGGQDSTSSLVPVYSFNLGFAGDGQVTSAADSVNGNWTYTYDPFNRLFTSNKNSGQQAFSYGYDRFGNRWNQIATAGTGPQPSFSFTGGNNQIDSGVPNCASATPFCYDAAGNLMNDGTHQYTYDAENRIVKVDGGATATYVYDAEGRRVRGQSEDYLYDLSDHSVALIGSSNGVWNYGEIYAAGRHIATYSGGTTNFDHADWLGTERMRSNAAGDSTPSETCTSLPFGDGLTCSGTDWSFRHFTGKDRDNESNLDYFGARYLGSAMGRFSTADSTADPDPLPWVDLDNPQTLNLYGYVLNNPLSSIDPDGHKHLECTTSIGATKSSTSGIYVLKFTTSCHEVEDLQDYLLYAAVMGHHFIPRQIFENLDLNPNSFQYKVLDRFTSGRLKFPKANYFDDLHRAYNKELERLINRYERRTGRALDKFEEGDFRAVAEEIKGAGGDTEAFLTRLSETNPEARTILEGLQNALESLRSTELGEAAGGAAEACAEGACIVP